LDNILLRNDEIFSTLPFYTRHVWTCSDVFRHVQTCLYDSYIITMKIQWILVFEPACVWTGNLLTTS